MKVVSTIDQRIMESANILPGANTVSKYLDADNDRLKKIIGMVAYNVSAAAKQASQALVRDRERVSDVADHLDGEFIRELEVDQVTEIEEIARINSELEQYFNNTIMKLAFKNFNLSLLKQLRELEKKEGELREREQSIEKIVNKRISELREQITRDSTTARGFFESALSKAEKVFDQNKITRFAYSTISVFQEEFFDLQGTHDVEQVTKLLSQLATRQKINQGTTGQHCFSSGCPITNSVKTNNRSERFVSASHFRNDYGDIFFLLLKNTGKFICYWR